MHKWHRLPGETGEGLIMAHNSRSRTLASSSCGRLQVQRDDPFDLEEANFSFYTELEEKLFPKFEKISVEIFNPDLAAIQDKVCLIAEMFKVTSIHILIRLEVSNFT